MTVQPSTIPKRRLGLWIRRVDGVIHTGYRDTALRLSDSAGLLFQETNGAHTVEDLARLLAAEYDISFEEALQDTTDFIHEMTVNGLMTLDG